MRHHTTHLQLSTLEDLATLCDLLGGNSIPRDLLIAFMQARHASRPEAMLRHLSQRGLLSLNKNMVERSSAPLPKRGACRGPLPTPLPNNAHHNVLMHWRSGVRKITRLEMEHTPTGLAESMKDDAAEVASYRECVREQSAKKPKRNAPSTSPRGKRTKGDKRTSWDRLVKERKCMGVTRYTWAGWLLDLALILEVRGGPVSRRVLSALTRVHRPRLASITSMEVSLSSIDMVTSAPDPRNRKAHHLCSITPLGYSAIERVKRETGIVGHFEDEVAAQQFLYEYDQIRR